MKRILFLFFTCSGSFLIAQGQNRTPDCADQMDKTYDCVEKLKISPDAVILDKKRDGVMQKCFPNVPEQCKTMKKAMDDCQSQISKDQSIIALRGQVKANISKCFERYPANSRRFDSPMGFRQPPPFAFGAGQQPPPPPPPGGAPFPGRQDPCAPSESQVRCIKNEMRNDTEAHEMAEKLDEQQRQCFNESNSDMCRLDGNSQLRDCVERTRQIFMHRSATKMQDCMQAAMNATSTWFF